MKKLLAILVAALAAIALCACGAEEIISVETGAPPADEGAIKATYDKACAFIDTAIGDMKANKQISSEDPTYLACDWEFEGAQQNYNMSDEIDLNGHAVVIGKTTMKEIKDYGFTFLGAPETVAPNEILGLTTLDGDKSVSLGTHGGDKEQTLDESVVYEFVAGEKEFAIPYNYCGVTVESTLKDVLTALGAPNISIHLGVDSSSATIDISYNDEVQENGQITTNRLAFTFKYDETNDSASITSLNRSLDTMEMQPEE